MTPHERAARALAWVYRHPGTTTSQVAAALGASQSTAWRALIESGCTQICVKPWRWYPPAEPQLPWWPVETSRDCGEPGCAAEASRTWRVHGWDTHRCEQHPPSATVIDALARLAGEVRR